MTAADAIVIGGGVFGCATADALTRLGARVTLLDASTPGRATSASAGGLWPVGESLGLGCGVIFHADQGAGLGPQPLPRAFMEFLRESNRRFPEMSARIREQTGIDVEVEHDTGLLYLLYDEAQQLHAETILDWLGEDSGTTAELWTPEQVLERDPLVCTDIRGAVHFPGDHQINPMLLAEGLKRVAIAAGARFVPEARVEGLDLEAGRITRVRTSAGDHSADVVINAAGAWAGQLAAMAGVSIPLFPVRGQIVCTETLPDTTLRTNLSTSDCYILQKSHGEILIGSTTEHADFSAEVRFPDLCQLARGAARAVPALREVHVKRCWAGLRPGTPDEFPILGPSEAVSNLHHATGGFRTGIVSSPLCAEIVAAQALGQAPPIPIGPFLPERFRAIAS